MSSPYATIACCIDSSEASALALSEARRLRAFGPGTLNVLHAPEEIIAYPSIALSAWIRHPSELLADAQVWLEAQIRDGEVPVLLSGYPPAAACRWAQEAGCDLLVAAAHRSLTNRLFVGGFATYVAYHAPCAVLLVRPSLPKAERLGETHAG